MMKILRALYLAPLLAVISLPATAHRDHGRDGFHPRLERQEMRIGHGIRSGALTRHETKKLYKQRKQLRKMRHKFASDGVLTPRERARLQRELHKDSRLIYKLKHNDRHRGYAQHGTHRPRGGFHKDHRRHDHHDRHYGYGGHFRPPTHGYRYGG
jgi:hypothetical protein